MSCHKVTYRALSLLPEVRVGGIMTRFSIQQCVITKKIVYCFGKDSTVRETCNTTCFRNEIQNEQNKYYVLLTCTSVHLCNNNQRDALFILRVFRQSTSTCFGHTFTPSSGSISYIYNTYRLLNEAYSESKYRFVVKNRVCFRIKFYCYQILHSPNYFSTYSPPLLRHISQRGTLFCIHSSQNADACDVSHY